MKSLASIFLVACAAVLFSSCIEFENEEVVYRYHETEDALLVTLRYEGIFGRTKGGFDDPAGDEATADKALSERQVEQLESVLEGGRAFFFNNWIAEYNRASYTEALQRGKDAVQEGEVFGKPEKKLLRALLDDVKVENIGFYLDEDKRLCGAQTLRIANLDKFLVEANKVIARQLEAKLSEMREERAKNPQDAPSFESIDGLAKAIKNDFAFLTREGNRLRVQFPMAREDYEHVEEETGQNLPDGVRLGYHDGIVIYEMGVSASEKVVLRKKCFAGYRPNTLNYLRGKHPKLLIKPESVEAAFEAFLSPGD